MPEVVAIQGVPRGYAWGSTSAIQSMLGRPVDGAPIAELWFGAHPDDASPAGETTLDALIAADPAGVLGAGVAERFGNLPYLLKVLAAGTALSIQVHPTIDQAREGYAREDAAGIAQGAPERNYRDRNHKPELLCALTEFEALCGFRPPGETVRLLDHLAVPGLAVARDLLAAGPGGLRAAFTCLLTMDDPAPVVDAVLARAAGPAPDGFAEALRAVQVAGADFPGDRGVLVALLLNAVRLAPGEAIYLGAGNVHGYLRGVGVEIMANSDNVLRCGLTPKHVDVAELLAVADFGVLPDPRWPAADGRFAVPVPDFALTRLELGAGTAVGTDAGTRLPGSPLPLPGDGPRIALCTSGAVTVGAVALAPGRAAFVRDGAHPAVAGAGTLFVAGVGSAGAD